MKIAFLYTFLILFSFGYSQPIFEPIGAKAWAMGGSNTAETNVFSTNNNIATLTEIQKIEIGIYNQLRFGLKNLNLINTSVALPNKWINIGIAANHYGYEKFNQQKITLGFAKKLNNNFSLGVNLNYLALNIAEQENTYAFTADVGSFYKINKQLQIGFFLSNITQSKYSNNTYGKVPNLAKFGVNYSINTKLFLLTDIEKIFDYDLVIRSGLSYDIHQNFGLQIGYTSNPNYFTCGFTAKFKQFDFNCATSLHSYLGFTPHVGLIFHAD
ncbi:MAG: hypothetical protein V4643_03640 [Bacteroidota bacterium]